MFFFFNYCISYGFTHTLHNGLLVFLSNMFLLDFFSNFTSILFFSFSVNFYINPLLYFSPTSLKRFIIASICEIISLNYLFRCRCKINRKNIDLRGLFHINAFASGSYFNIVLCIFKMYIVQ